MKNNLFLAGLLFPLGILGQGNVRTFDTVEQMTNATLTSVATGDKSTVVVRGLSSLAGGIFYLALTDTNAVDNLTYYPQPNGGRWIRLSDWIDGGAGSNQTNSTTQPGILPTQVINSLWMNEAWRDLSGIFLDGTNTTVTITNGTVAYNSTGGGSGGSTVYVFGSEYPHLNFIDDPTAQEVMRVGIFGTTNLYSYIDWDQMTNHILAGANMTVSLVGDALVLESLGGAGGTNGTPVTVNGGADLVRANFQDGPNVKFTLAGTNITATVITNSLTTNEIDTTFYTLLTQTNSGSSTGSVVRVNAGSSIPDASFDSSSFIAFANAGGSITATVVNSSLGTNKLDSQVYNLLIQTNGGGGTGDVVGPSGASNNAVAIYDGTTGKLIKNSRITVEGDTNLFVTGYASGLDAIQADQFVTLRQLQSLGTGGTNVGSLLQVLGGAYLYLTNVSAGPTSAELAFNSMFGIVTNIIVTGGGTSDKAHITMSLSPGLTDTNYQVMFTSHGNQGDGIPVSSIEHTFQGTNEVRFVVAYSANSGAPNELKLIFWIVDYNGVASIVSGGGGTGDVAGPGSSTDNAVVRWDGTAGTSVQNSSVIMQDDGATVIGTNATSTPMLTLWGTNTTSHTVQGGYIMLRDYPSLGAAANNFMFGSLSNTTAATSPNIRIQADYWSPTNAGTHVGINVGGTPNSSFVVKRQTAAQGSNSFIGLRGINYLTGTDTTEEFTVTMTPIGAGIATAKGEIALAPFDGVTRIEGTTAPVSPTTGEGLEVWYDTDDTSFGGSGRTDLISYDRTANLWGAIRLSGTNIIVRRGTTVALQVDNSANVLIPQTNFVGELLVTNGITLGGTRRTTWPTGTTPTYETLPSVPSSATNHVLDFGFSALTYSVTNNVNLLQSTNRPGNATNVLYSVMRLAGDTVDRTLSWHASWKRLGTNITTIPSNKVVVVSAMCIGTDETGVTFGVAKEE